MLHAGGVKYAFATDEAIALLYVKNTESYLIINKDLTDKTNYDITVFSKLGENL